MIAQLAALEPVIAKLGPAGKLEVMRALAEGHNAALAAEHTQLEERIAELWDEQRAARATLRNGDRELIIQRARQEERLSRAA